MLGGGGQRGENEGEHLKVKALSGGINPNSTSSLSHFLFS